MSIGNGGPPDDTHFTLNGAVADTPEYQALVDIMENEEMVREEREPPPMPDTTPLRVVIAALMALPAFPPNLLPPVLERRAVDVAKRLGVDPAMVALPMLAICASAIDDRVQIWALAA